MKKKVLIIGFGSIGKRHALIFDKLKDVEKIFILSKYKNHKYVSVSNIEEARLVDPDLIIICSKTSDHYNDLRLVEKTFKNKTVLVEKPLFDKNKNLEIKNNKILVGYNLRYHPIIQFLKEKIKNKKIFSIYIFCGSYLPHWRKGRSYKKSYSSSKKNGGGVLLDLSHEIDYIQWIFGKIRKIDYANIKKISKLEIKSDDYVNILGNIKKISFSINLNYFTMIHSREIFLDGKNFSVKANLIDNTVKLIENGKKKHIKFNVDRNFTYKKQNYFLLNNNFTVSSSFKEAKEIMVLIDKIRNFNK